MQSECLHIAMEEDVLAEVDKLRVRVAVGKQGAYIQPQFLQYAVFDNAVAVKQVGEESIAVDGIQVGFLDRKLTGALHVAKYGVHL